MFDFVCRGGVSEERAQVRREVVAELVEYAKRRAAGHAKNYEAAIEHGRDEMAQPAYSNQNAWLEVSRVLRMDMPQR